MKLIPVDVKNLFHIEIDPKYLFDNLIFVINNIVINSVYYHMFDLERVDLEAFE